MVSEGIGQETVCALAAVKRLLVSRKNSRSQLLQPATAISQHADIGTHIAAAPGAKERPDHFYSTPGPVGDGDGVIDGRQAVAASGGAASQQPWKTTMSEVQLPAMQLPWSCQPPADSIDSGPPACGLLPRPAHTSLEGRLRVLPAAPADCKPADAGRAQPQLRPGASPSRIPQRSQSRRSGEGGHLTEAAQSTSVAEDARAPGLQRSVEPPDRKSVV